MYASQPGLTPGVTRKIVAAFYGTSGGADNGYFLPVDFINRQLAHLHWLLHKRRTLAAWGGAALLICLWIGWAVYVGTTNGWTAALGVLITWPLLAALAAMVVLAGLGVRRLSQRGRSPAGMPGIAGAGPPPKLPKGHDSVTTLTFPS